MDDVPLNKQLQFKLRGMLLLTTAVSIVLGIGKHLGMPAMTFVLIGLLAAFAVLNSRWKYLLASDYGIIWWGAATASLSVFFTVTYGPMGGAIKYLLLLGNIDFSWLGLACASELSSFFAAPLVGLGALAALTYQSSNTVSRCRLGIVIATILLVTITELSVIVKFRGFIPTEAHIVLDYATSLAVLIATFLVVALKCISRKSPWLHILLAVWAICHLYPIPSSENLFDTLALMGPAYWMLVIGYLAILIGSVLESKRGILRQGNRDRDGLRFGQ